MLMIRFLACCTTQIKFEIKLQTVFAAITSIIIIRAGVMHFRFPTFLNTIHDNMSDVHFFSRS